MMMMMIINMTMMIRTLMTLTIQGVGPLRWRQQWNDFSEYPGQGDHLIIWSPSQSYSPPMIWKWIRDTSTLMPWTRTCQPWGSWKPSSCTGGFTFFCSHYLSYKSTIFKNVMFRLQFRTLDFTGLCFHRNYIWRHLEGIGSTGLKEASWTEIHQNLVFKRVRSSNSKEENYVKQYLELLFKEQNISRLKEEQREKRYDVNKNIWRA